MLLEEVLEKQKTSVEMVSSYTFGPLNVKQMDARLVYKSMLLALSRRMIRQLFLLLEILVNDVRSQLPVKLFFMLIFAIVV